MKKAAGYDSETQSNHRKNEKSNPAEFTSALQNQLQMQKESIQDQKKYDSRSQEQIAKLKKMIE